MELRLRRLMRRQVSTLFLQRAACLGCILPDGAHQLLACETYLPRCRRVPTYSGLGLAHNLVITLIM